MFLWKMLKAAFAVVLAVGLPGQLPSLVPAARAEVALPSAISPDARDALARSPQVSPPVRWSARRRQPPTTTPSPITRLIAIRPIHPHTPRAVLISPTLGRARPALQHHSSITVYVGEVLE